MARRARDEEEERERQRRELEIAQQLAATETRRADAAQAFLTAERDRAETAERLAQEQQRSAERVRRTAKILTVLIFVAAVFAIVAIQQTGRARQQRAEAEAQQQLSRSRELAASAVSALASDPELSILLAAEGVRVRRTLEAEDALRQALLESHVRRSCAGTGRCEQRRIQPRWQARRDGERRRHRTRVGRDDRKTDSRIAWPYRVREYRGVQQRWTFDCHRRPGQDAAGLEATNGSLVAELRGHGSEKLLCAAFSPDGKLSLVTAGGDPVEGGDTTARVWDVATGKTTAELRGHGAAITTAAFSPDGRRIVTAGHESTARLYEAATGHIVAELSGDPVRKVGLEVLDTEINHTAFNVTGELVVTASSDGTARIWETKKESKLPSCTGMAAYTAQHSIRVYPC